MVLKKILCVFKYIMIVVLIFFIICFASIVYQKKVLNNNMPNLFGYVGGTIVSASMEPSIKIGDYVIAKANGGYNVGDVVLFKHGNSFIAHRVVEIYDDYIITKGDNNETVDVDTDVNTVVGPVVKVYSGVGKFIMFLSQYKYLVFLIVVLIVVLI